MFIVRDISTNVVVAISEAEPVFDDSGCQIGDVLMLGVTADLHEVVEGDGPETMFVPGLLTLVDDVWTVTDQGDYDAVVAALTPPPAPLPDLTMRQFRLGLLHAGLLAGVEAAISALDEPERTIAGIEFEYARTVVRTDPWIAALAGILGLTDTEMDALWVWAATL